MVRRRIAIGLLSCMLVLVGCSGGSTAAVAMGAQPRASADPAGAASAAAAINDFGFDLLRRVQGDDHGVVISPASIVLALAMTRPGARGETAAQIDAVLREVATDDHASWLNALDAALASRSGVYRDMGGEDATVSLRIANAPFAQSGYDWNADYLGALSSRFGAGIRLVDYTAAAEAARQAINAWVADQTEDRIPELVGQGAIDALTRLVLVNAIYLKAPWLTPFNAAATTTESFNRADGSTVDASFMHLTSDFGYARGDGWHAVDVPYVDGSLTMTLVLPEDPAGFVASLDGASFQALVDSLEARQVALALPRFGLETRAELGPLLSAMGMPAAFDPGIADFSGMTEAERLYISAVIHQANIDVDEAGTTASAATAVIMRATSMPAQPTVVTFDRPFLFALRDGETGAVLFLGRVDSPAERS